MINLTPECNYWGFGKRSWLLLPGPLGLIRLMTNCVSVYWGSKTYFKMYVFYHSGSLLAQAQTKEEADACKEMDWLDAIIEDRIWDNNHLVNESDDWIYDF